MDTTNSTPPTTDGGDADVAPITHRGAGAYVDPRMVKYALAVLFGSILIGVLAIAFTADTPEPTKPTGKATIIPAPNEGAAPEDPGDRGGWEQLALMGLILTALVGIGVFAVRGRGAKTRPRRAAWEAAAAAGVDGAADGRASPAP